MGGEADEVGSAVCWPEKVMLAPWRWAVVRRATESLWFDAKNGPRGWLGWLGGCGRQFMGRLHDGRWGRMFGCVGRLSRGVRSFFSSCGVASVGCCKGSRVDWGRILGVGVGLGRLGFMWCFDYGAVWFSFLRLASGLRREAKLQKLVCLSFSEEVETLKCRLSDSPFSPTLEEARRHGASQKWIDGGSTSDKRTTVGSNLFRPPIASSSPLLFTGTIVLPQVWLHLRSVSLQIANRFVGSVCCLSGQKLLCIILVFVYKFPSVVFNPYFTYCWFLQLLLSSSSYAL